MVESHARKAEEAFRSGDGVHHTRSDVGLECSALHDAAEANNVERLTELLAAPTVDTDFNPERPVSNPSHEATCVLPGSPT